MGKIKVNIRFLFLAAFLLIVKLCVSQNENLVVNGDFEEYINCPEENAFYDKEYFNYSLKSWYLPTAGTSDYLNICSKFEYLSIPKSYFGVQVTKSGEGYAGISIFNLLNENKNYREYLSVKLKDKLQKGDKYKFTMYVSLAENSVAGCNNLGVYFHSDSLHGRIITKRIIEQPQEISSIRVLGNVDYNNVLERNQIIMDTANWVKIEFVYTAKGNEKYLTIGNFRSDRQTKCKKFKNINREREIETYYFIDDVSLMKLDE